ncbi:hypothetical protein BD779DRAFT_1571792 [Infundibulicybe gibba]|nr:hypothetical protein BD779DRAFT_1571792 [Infundibulicybe gibba]
MPSANQRQSTFVAQLHPWASKFNLKPHLSSITLANVLAGDTSYLAFREYSLETLQFIVWFQDYRKRYFQVTAPQEAHGLGEQDFAFATPSYAEVDRRATESLDEPLLEECMRILATFIRPGAVKELTIDAVVREPLFFLPIYEEMFNSLERVSLPQFLASASANINLPKQFFWYGIGFIDLSISIAIAMSLIFMLPTPPESNRAWRLFAVPFACFGSMQFYSAWRGFCNQVWMRGGTQLRVWELQEMDEESRVYADKVLQPRQLAEIHPGLEKLGTSSSGLYMHKGDDDDTSSSAYPTPVLSANPTQDLAAIAPFTVAEAGHPAPIMHYPTSLMSGFMRPPIFGPERVVMDPRIKAVHQQVMNDILRAFCVIIFAIPGCGPKPRS